MSGRPTIGLVRSVSVSLALKALGAVSAFAFFAFVGRVLGASHAGEFFACLSVLTVASTLSRLGADTLLLNRVTERIALNDTESAKVWLAAGSMTVLVSAVCLSVTLHSLSPLVSLALLDNSNEGADLIRKVSLWVTPLALIGVFSETLRAIGNVRAHIFVLNVGIPLYAILILGVCGFSVSLNQLINVYGGSTLLTCALAGALCYRFFKGVPYQVGRASILGVVVQGKGYLVVAALQMAVAWTPYIILAAMSESREVGLFGMAMRYVTVVGMLLMATNSVMAARFGTLYAEEKMDELGTLVRQATLLLVLTATPVCLIMVIWASPLMGLFGGSFKGGGDVLRILVVGQYCNIAAGSVGLLLVMCGQVHQLTFSLSVTATLGLIVNILLIPSWGAVGAATSYVVMMLVLNGTSSVLVFKTLRLRTVPRFGGFARQ